MKIAFSQTFQKNLKRLSKKYKNITHDVNIFINDIQNQKKPGKKLKHIPGCEVYKARIKNSSAKTGKSGGFRVIYYLKAGSFCFLLTIYVKNEKANINSQEVLDILQQLSL